MILNLIGRKEELFSQDIANHENLLSQTIQKSSFLVIGGAGSIGQAVVAEIFKRSPQKLHVVDISENNMVELVRDIRSSLGYIKGDFRTFIMDTGSIEFDSYLEKEGVFDYILNLSALKHVRSEKDEYTLMRMVDVNILNTDKTIRIVKGKGSKKYFAVSTDKASNPANIMGASKRIMELFLMKRSLEMPVSTARFANVAFSDGSLLHGFIQRMNKMQPIAAPKDVRRYFMTQKESGELCLMSCILGENRDIFFPKLDENIHMITFSNIAVRFLEAKGYEPYLCETEEEARKKVSELAPKKKWPCYFFDSDTTGEKEYEEFFMENETLDFERFQNIGVIKNEPVFNADILEFFEFKINKMKESKRWTKEELVELFKFVLPSLLHKETGKHLDERM